MIRKLGSAVLAVLLGAASHRIASAQGGRAIVSAGTVSVYSRMSTSSEVVKSLKRGDTVSIDFSITTPDGAWCSVVEPGQTEPLGYVLCRLLDRRQPSPSAGQPAPSLAPRGELIRFRFNPPAGMSFVQTQKTTKVKTLGESRRLEDVTESKVRVSVNRTAEGYSLAYRVLSATVRRNGQTIPSEIPEWLQNTVVIYDVDAGGRLLRVRGWETVHEQLMKSMPEQAAQFMSSLLSEQMLVNHAKFEWDARIGVYAGREARIGESWSGTHEFPLPAGGAAPFDVTTKLAGRVPCGGHNCVRIEFTAESDSEAIARVLTGMFDEFSASVPGPQKPRVEDAEMVSAGARLMDPDTMLIHSETVTRTVRLKLAVPGKGSETAVLDETREYSSSYPQ